MIKNKFTKSEFAKKRKLIEEVILQVFSLLDDTGKNTKKYKDEFDSYSDEDFHKYIYTFLSDPEKNFFLEVSPYDNEPILADIEKAANYLKVPLEEVVYLKHDGNQNDPIATKKGLVG